MSHRCSRRDRRWHIRKTSPEKQTALSQRALGRTQLQFRSFEAVHNFSTMVNRRAFAAYRCVGLAVVAEDMSRNTPSLSASCWMARRRLLLDDDYQLPPSHLGAGSLWALLLTNIPIRRRNWSNSASVVTGGPEHTRRQYPASPSSYPISTSLPGDGVAPRLTRTHGVARDQRCRVSPPRKRTFDAASSSTHPSYPPPHPDAVARAHRRTHAPSTTPSTCAAVMLQDLPLSISVVEVVSAPSHPPASGPYDGQRASSRAPFAKRSSP
ncbi:hypothetical protein HMN09_00863300 [Mycena chlorophos]|uniref:Uncharacterized protein n=1 Tax=Mycena chlorophos TaxID=658473 RepID=A0A8H6SUH8_MYCCL|nr:hypothetical protein HMN09_00863300 [Mycena chlorophos]